MRILRGKYKGRKLQGYHLSGTRPTMSRVKESFFAMIQSEVSSATILDLFSGSGNLGLEALSMGAKNVIFVDSQKKACSVIYNNLSFLGVNHENYQVLCKDYKQALSYFHEEKLSFDIIFLDPPYQTTYIEKSLSHIQVYHLLNTGGLVVCESDSLEKIVYDKEYYKEEKMRKYGDKYVVILRKI